MTTKKTTATRKQNPASTALAAAPTLLLSELREQIVAALGRQLGQEFGRGFGEKNLRRMIRFAVVFPDEKIVSALRTQLGWTHFKAIIPLDDPLKRDFISCEPQG